MSVKYTTSYVTDCGEWFLRRIHQCRVVLRNPLPIGKGRPGEQPDLIGFAFSEVESHGRMRLQWITYEIEVKGEDDSCDAERSKVHNQEGAWATGDYRYQLAAPTLQVFKPFGVGWLMPTDKRTAYIVDGHEPAKNPRVNRDREWLLLLSVMAQMQVKPRYGVAAADSRPKPDRKAIRGRRGLRQLDDLAKGMGKGELRHLGPIARDMEISNRDLKRLIEKDERFEYAGGRVVRR